METIQLTVRGLPAKTHSLLKQAAEKHGRSINAEAVRWIEERARQEAPPPGGDELLKRIEARKTGVKATEAEKRRWRREGRA